jgi:hypothetical protein
MVPTYAPIDEAHVPKRVTARRGDSFAHEADAGRGTWWRADVVVVVMVPAMHSSIVVSGS